MPEVADVATAEEGSDRNNGESSWKGSGEDRDDNSGSVNTAKWDGESDKPWKNPSRRSDDNLETDDRKVHDPHEDRAALCACPCGCNMQLHPGDGTVCDFCFVQTDPQPSCESPNNCPCHRFRKFYYDTDDEDDEESIKRCESHVRDDRDINDPKAVARY